ncbi:hypothetical protein VKT23_020652 [Stygiomarasmius scandens]|uniref:Uncharacterized protein n=1 Tax=Marasmiellus scandens TaxID=2682957 RepID=A0ABR1IKE1_9AGAR
MEFARTEELLRSLSPLSSSDIVEIPLMSAKINEEVKRYETEICQLESRIMYLRSKQEFLQRRREKLDSLPAPVRRLPTELLSLIFISVSVMTTVLCLATVDCSRSHSSSHPYVIAGVKWLLPLRTSSLASASTIVSMMRTRIVVLF